MGLDHNLIKGFGTIENTFIHKLILQYSDPMQLYRLVTNTSLSMYKAVFLQEGPNANWHPVAYLSGSFSPLEQNYDVHDLELLTIIKALEYWKHYLEGARNPFEIWTDHKNLIYFQDTQDLSRRQAR